VKVCHLNAIEMLFHVVGLPSDCSTSTVSLEVSCQTIDYKFNSCDPL